MAIMPAKRSRVKYEEDADPDPNATDEGVENLWGHLPHELLLRILARLPVISFFRLRRVCKTWNNLIHSPLFLEMCSHVPLRNFEHFGHAAMGIGTLEYHPRTRVLEFGTGCHRRGGSSQNLKDKYRRKLDFLPSKSLSLVAGDGGLLCFSDLEKKGDSRAGTMRWWVCNPVTMKWRELPPKLNVRFWPRVHMIVDSNPFRYRIIVNWLASGTWQEYDSVTSCWTVDRLLIARSYPLSILCGDYNYSFPHLELRLDNSP